MAVEYMDPNRPKLITPPEPSNPPSKEHGPGQPFEGDGMWPADSEANRGQRTVPIQRGQ